MELRAYARVLRRFRMLVLLGVVAAGALAILSYYKPTSGGLEPRAQQVWQATADILLTQPGFPAGRIDQAGNVGRLIAIAPLYAHLANGDAVNANVKRAWRARGVRPPDGEITTIPTADTTYGSVSGLPAITIIAKSSTAQGALALARQQVAAFLGFLRSEQAAARIRGNARVGTQILNSPRQAKLIVPRKKTLPVVVFLGILFATIATAFVLDNARPGSERTAPHEGERPEPTRRGPMGGPREHASATAVKAEGMRGRGRPVEHEPAEIAVQSAARPWRASRDDG